jgi:predicted DNA binding CopG/RHH family protein
MKAEYDLARLKSRRNPYASKLKRSVTMRLSDDVVTYFKRMAADAGVPYQSLINLYLRDCVLQHRQVRIAWPSQDAP